MEFSALAYLAAGLVGLIVGANLLVRGASRLALRAGLSPLVIGLTVVAYGTSAPELAACIAATAGDHAAIALGNVVGSNIFNILLVLGVSAAIAPLTISRKLIRLDVPVMIGASILLLLLAAAGELTLVDGLLLLILFGAYAFWRLRRSKGGTDNDNSRWKQASLDRGRVRRLPPTVTMIVAGAGMLVLGGHWLVKSAAEVAAGLGFSESVIGLTLVSVGTSLPEAVTSIIAVARGEREIAVGNVVGSNITNILLIMGAATLASGGGIRVTAAILNFDIPVMLAAAIACLPILYSGYRISRWEGFFFLGYYLTYVTYLYLETTRHESLATYNWVMVLFVLPLGLVTLGAISLQAFLLWRKRR